MVSWRNLYQQVFDIHTHSYSIDAYLFSSERWIHLNSLDFPSSFGAYVSQVRHHTGLYLYIIVIICLSRKLESIFARLSCSAVVYNICRYQRDTPLRRWSNRRWEVEIFVRLTWIALCHARTFLVFLTILVTVNIINMINIMYGKLT